MTGRLIHVGEDHWHRVLVLRRAGLAVDECRDVEELTRALRTGTDPEAVMLAASPVFNPAPAIDVVRSAVKCPVVLFSTGENVAEPRHYDLLVHPLTDPAEWLQDVWELIHKSRRLCADSRMLGEASGILRKSPRGQAAVARAAGAGEKAGE